VRGQPHHSLLDCQALAGWLEPTGGEAGVHEQLPQACGALPDVEGAREGAGAVDGAGIGPETIEGGEGVTGVAGDQQLVALLGGGEGVGAAGETKAGGVGAVEPVEAGEVPQIGQGKGEGVVARSGEIKGLDGGESREELLLLEADWLATLARLRLRPVPSKAMVDQAMVPMSGLPMRP
jgi:hypothetical protein